MPLKTPIADRILEMVSAFSDKERRQAVRDIFSEVVCLEDRLIGLTTALDFKRRELNRVTGLLRNARQVIWEHHADGIMAPDVCPFCTRDKEAKWIFEQIDELLK